MAWADRNKSHQKIRLGVFKDTAVTSRSTEYDDPIPVAELSGHERVSPQGYHIFVVGDTITYDWSNSYSPIGSTLVWGATDGRAEWYDGDGVLQATTTATSGTQSTSGWATGTYTGVGDTGPRVVLTLEDSEATPNTVSVTIGFWLE